MYAPWRQSHVHWVVGLLMIFRAVYIQFRSGSKVQEDASTSTKVIMLRDTVKHTCPLRLYVYPPTNKLLLNDPKYPAFKKGDLLLEDYFLESEIFRTYFSKNIRHCTVANPDEANAFLVPHTSAAHLYNTQNYNRNAFLDYYQNVLKPFLERIRNDLPYFNASLPQINSKNPFGDDDDAIHARRLSSNHFFVSVFDNGPFCDDSSHAAEEQVFSDDIWKEVVAPMRQIGYYNQLHQVIPKRRQSARRTECFVQGGDIALPMWNDWAVGDGKDDLHIRSAARTCHSVSSPLSQDGVNISPECFPWLQFLHRRASIVSKTFYFRGAVTKGKQCAPGIRSFLKEYCQQEARDECHFIDSQGPTNNITIWMGTAIFALCPAGFACWSARFYDAFHRMTIPIRLADEIVEPFASTVPGGEGTYRDMMVSLQATNKKDHERESAWTFDPMNVTQQLNALAEYASEWRETCSNIENSLSCLSHPISSRLRAIALHRHWFSWSNSRVEEGAFTLLEREIWERVNIL